METWRRMCCITRRRAKPAQVTATKTAEHRLSRALGYPLCSVARAKRQAVTYALLSPRRGSGQHISAVPRSSLGLDLLHSWEEMRGLHSQAISKILPTDFINK